MQSGQKLEKLLCVGGMHGNGHYALRSLVDGHPQVVAYPFFLANFFRYWRHGVFRGLKSNRLVEYVWPVVSDDPIFSANIGSSKDSIGFKDEDVKVQFRNRLLKFERDNKVLSLETVLYCLIDAYRSTLSDYSDKEVIYYAFEVDAREFPWSDSSFVQNVTHLFTYRDFARSYTSHRADFLERHGWTFPYFLFTRATLELSQLKYCWKNVKSQISNPKLILFPFESMRDSSESVMMSISEKLGIRYDPCLLYLTRIGLPENGFTTDGHATNRISAKGGNYFLPMTTSENAATHFCSPIDLSTGLSIKLTQMSFIQYLKCAWTESFFTIPDLLLSNDVSVNAPILGEQITAYSRRKIISILKRLKISCVEGYSILSKQAKIPFLSKLLLRPATFFGLVSAYMTARWFGGRWVLWPHLVFLIRLNLYHRIERKYKVNANAEMAADVSN